MIPLSKCFKLLQWQEYLSIDLPRIGTNNSVVTFSLVYALCYEEESCNIKQNLHIELILLN